MDSKNNEQTELLRNIWGEMKALNARIDKTNDRLDKTNDQLDAVRVDLSARIDLQRTELKDESDALRRRLVESETRMSTATTQLSSDVHELSGLIREWREEHRADRVDLRARILRLEQQAGIR